MSDKVEYSRLLLKRSNVSLEVPTIPTGNTLNEMTDTDTFVGEFYLNAVDNRLWVRTDNGQYEIMMSGNTSGYSQTLAATLTYGNETGGYNIVITSGDTIQSVSGNSVVTLTDNTSTIIQTDGVDKTTEISLDKEFITLNSTNTDDGYEIEFQIDGQNAQMFEIVGNTGLINFSRTTRQMGSISDYCGDNTNTDYSSVVQDDNDIYSLIVSGGSEMTKWHLKDNQISGSTTNGVNTSLISLTPNDITLDTLSVIIENLPTSSSGLTSNQLFTQTATELGGSGSTKVICIV
jgi:hypothetical protein